MLLLVLRSNKLLISNKILGNWAQFVAADYALFANYALFTSLHGAAVTTRRQESESKPMMNIL
jgi:hypothetical protein